MKNTLFYVVRSFSADSSIAGKTESCFRWCSNCKFDSECISSGRLRSYWPTVWATRVQSRRCLRTEQAGYNAVHVWAGKTFTGLVQSQNCDTCIRTNIVILCKLHKCTAVMYATITAILKMLSQASCYRVICPLVAELSFLVSLKGQFLVGRAQLYRLSLVDAHTVAQNQYTGK